MYWIEKLRLWSQDLYTACLADYSLVNVHQESEQLREIIRNYTKFFPEPTAPPSLRNHATRESDKLTLREPDFSNAQVRFSKKLARILLLDLDTLLDETLKHFIESKGGTPTGGTESYLNQSGASFAGLEWAKYRCVELSVVRNCIVHNNGKFESAQINRLAALNINLYEVPTEGAEVNVSLAHLFAYKTAVRHILTLCACSKETKSNNGCKSTKGKKYNKPDTRVR